MDIMGALFSSLEEKYVSCKKEAFKTWYEKTTSLHFQSVITFPNNVHSQIQNFIVDHVVRTEVIIFRNEILPT